MFETRSDAWEKAGLAFQVNSKQVQSARRQMLVLVPLLIAVDVAYHVLNDGGKWKPLANAKLTFLETPITILTVIVVMALGFGVARALGRYAGPTLMRRMDPATAGTFGFLTRLVTMAVALIVALSIAGVQLKTLAVGGAFTAVILGLAAQQTLGNVIAGMVLLSARPFRVGERVRFQAGSVGGSVEGIVSSLGLLYTVLSRGADQIMIPNNIVLAAAVVPLKEPDSIDVKVRLTSGVLPSQVQAILDQEISIPTRNRASVLLEEVDGEDVVVRVQATPERAHQGAKLADEIMAALSSVTGEHQVANNGTSSNR